MRLRHFYFKRVNANVGLVNTIQRLTLIDSYATHLRAKCVADNGFVLSASPTMLLLLLLLAKQLLGKRRSNSDRIL